MAKAKVATLVNEPQSKNKVTQQEKVTPKLVCEDIGKDDLVPYEERHWSDGDNFWVKILYTAFRYFLNFRHVLISLLGLFLHRRHCPDPNLMCFLWFRHCVDPNFKYF